MDGVDVCIIGAGPSGAIAAAMLVQQGYSVVVLEKTQFPRFSIGESLLPQCMEFIEQAGMTQAVIDAGFQFKNGAAFSYQGRSASFDFSEKVTEGPGTTYQVQRDRFDKILADEAQRMGARIYYRHEIMAVSRENGISRVSYIDDQGNKGGVEARFVLDASGYGRVLPRLFDLDMPSGFPARQSLFTHIEDNIQDQDFDRQKILITIHPQHRDVWFWLIPFSNGRSSIGVVTGETFLARSDLAPLAQLQQLLGQDVRLKQLLQGANFDTPVQKITGYAANVKSLYGDGFALLGNAGEFLDPVFSSGVTIAMKSAVLAAEVLHRQLQGEPVDWADEYAVPLMQGVDTFRVFVQAWYDQRLQNIIFYPDSNEQIKAMICSILAGYAWDKRNPFVANSEQRLNTLSKICDIGNPE